MSIPTHNLYDFIHQALENKFNLLFFYPYGFKRLQDLQCYYDLHIRKFPITETLFYTKSIDNVCHKIMPSHYLNYLNLQEPDDYHNHLMKFNPIIICHDQEPLNFDFYEDDYNHLNYIQDKKERSFDYEIKKTKNLRWRYSRSYQKKWILLHSEHNGYNLEKYKNTGDYECVHWWSHAYLALDWYRFAEHDKFLNQYDEKRKIFLLYARDKTGSRTYREDLINSLSSKTKECTQIGSFYQTTDTSNLSAEYNFYDYNKTNISVVLETVFDDRIHLTEKTLRPIAVGHPFILVAGSQSLQYLKNYGFKTFSPWINEDYDNEIDTKKRMHMIANELDRIANLSSEELIKITTFCNEIAEYNKQRFFSKEFQEQIKNELVDNVNLAQLKCNNELDVDHIMEHVEFRKKQNPKIFEEDPIYKYAWLYSDHLKKGGTLEDYVPPDLD